MAILGRILARRKMRVALWTDSVPSVIANVEEVGVGGKDKWDSIEMILNRPADPPAWMKSRELRDVEYLRSLMKVCAGIMDEREWELEMEQTRNELLPPRKKEFNQARMEEWRREVEAVAIRN